MEKHKYEQAVSEFNKWRSLIKTVVGRQLLLFIKKLDTFRSKYGEIVNASKISIGVDEIYDFWNESDIETVPEKRCKYLFSKHVLS